MNPEEFYAIHGTVNLSWKNTFSGFMVVLFHDIWHFLIVCIVYLNTFISFGCLQINSFPHLFKATCKAFWVVSVRAGIIMKEGLSFILSKTLKVCYVHARCFGAQIIVGYIS